MQLLLTLIFYALLVGIFVLVFLMWRSGTKRAEKLSQTLMDATLKSADAAKEAAAAVHLLARKEHPP